MFSGTFSNRAESIDDYALMKLAAVERLLATEDHWCKGALRDGQGRFCLLGALDMAGARHLLAPVVLRAARELNGKHYWRIESFNDDRRTAHADIVRVLHRARATIAAGTVRLGPAEPWPRRYGEAFRALRARAGGALKPYFMQMAGGFGRLFPSPAAAAK
jgi:hypothetical protein